MSKRQRTELLVTRATALGSVEFIAVVRTILPGPARPILIGSADGFRVRVYIRVRQRPGVVAIAGRDWRNRRCVRFLAAGYFCRALIAAFGQRFANHTVILPGLDEARILGAVVAVTFGGNVSAGVWLKARRRVLKRRQIIEILRVVLRRS